MLNDYWRDKLNRAEKRLYDSMVYAFLNCKEQVDCAELGVESISKIYNYVCNDRPELFYLPYNPRVEVSSSYFGKKTTLITENIFGKSQINKMRQHIAEVGNRLAGEVQAEKSETAKERFVCDYLLADTTYEVNNLFNQNAGTVICQRKGQCSGIAKAAKLLFDRIGISSIIVNGTAIDSNLGTKGPHSWNIVKINNDWFHLDITFMLGANLQKIKPYRYLYFNYSDDEIRQNHSWAEGSTPRCPKSSAPVNDFGTVKSANTVVSSLYELKILLKKAMAGPTHCLTFESGIKLPTGKLMPAIQNCCQDVLSTAGHKINMTISIRGNTVAIEW